MMPRSIRNSLHSLPTGSLSRPANMPGNEKPLNHDEAVDKLRWTPLTDKVGIPRPRDPAPDNDAGLC